MSQTATLYHVSKENFIKLNNPDSTSLFNRSMAINEALFQGSFMALEYMLAKDQDTESTELIKGIFFPTPSLGEVDFEQLTLEEQIAIYENGSSAPYLDVNTIEKLYHLLEKISEKDLELMYNPAELNQHNIYPGVWHNDNHPDMAYNFLQLSEDFANLKAIIRQAYNEKDYIFVFVG